MGIIVVQHSTNIPAVASSSFVVATNSQTLWLAKMITHKLASIQCTHCDNVAKILSYYCILTILKLIYKKGYFIKPN